MLGSNKWKKNLSLDKHSKKVLNDALFELQTEIELLDTPSGHLLKILEKVKSSIASVFFFADDGAVVDIRTDLKCPHCESLVYDNRAKKRDPNDSYYQTKKPDFACSNYEPEDCSGGQWNPDKTVYWSASWWQTSGNIPKEWNI